MNKAFAIFNVIKLSLSKFENYEGFFENYIKKEKEEIGLMWDQVQPFEQEGDELTGGASQDYVDFLIEYSEQVEVNFANTFRSSFLIQMMSLIEYHLKYTCEIHSHFSKSGYKLDDLAGGDLDKCKKYLQKSCSVDFGVVNNEWNFIKSMYRVRNKFVHNSGLLSEGDIDDEIKSLSAKGYFIIQEVRNTGHYTLYFKNKMNHKLLELTKTFFEKLTNALVGTFEVLDDNT